MDKNQLRINKLREAVRFSTGKIDLQDCLVNYYKHIKIYGSCSQVENDIEVLKAMILNEDK